MKTTISIFILFLVTLGLQAEDGHHLWLRNKGNVPVNIVCSKNSVTINIAKEELQQGWQGKAGASVILTIKSDKTIKGDGFKLGANEIKANTELGILYGVY